MEDFVMLEQQAMSAGKSFGCDVLLNFSILRHLRLRIATIAQVQCATLQYMVTHTKASLVAAEFPLSIHLACPPCNALQCTLHKQLSYFCDSSTAEG
jgi:hypothetical protein